MSYVTNLILHMDGMEEEQERIQEVNAFFDERTRPFIGLHDTELLPHGWYGGSKYLECHVYVGAFNYLDLDGLLKHLGTVKWSYPAEVQLFIKDENEETFRLVHGVEQTDPRLWKRDDLLFQANDLLEALGKILSQDTWVSREIRNWIEEYRQLREHEQS